MRAPRAVNQMLPSGPATTLHGYISESGSANSVNTPAGVMRPSVAKLDSVNQKLPSGPRARLSGAHPIVGMSKYVAAPVIVILPICAPPRFIVNHRLPSVPATSAQGPPDAASGNSVNVPLG